MSKVKRQFDFTKCKQRHIALKILYFGWDFDGLASQAENENTIEHHLFQALTRTCLIESRDKCNYNRCGRTDKGVSSFGQVVDLDVRSNLIDEDDPQNLGLFSPESYSHGDEIPFTRTRTELDYVNILNRVLPEHIKVIAWAPVKKGFSSRFSCQSRSYSYIFPHGDLCISSIEKALSYLIGEHDFRNLCSFDLKNGVKNHRRTILSTHFRPLKFANDNSGTRQDAYSFYEVVIVGQAFLYHQIRCIMTILLLVGTRQESPEVVKELLDIQNCTSRPNYNKASPYPLCLFDCEYKQEDIPFGWMYNQLALSNLVRQLKQLWTRYKTKTLMIERALFNIETILKYEATCSEDGQEKKRYKTDSGKWRDFGLECDNMSDAKYIPLLKRPRDETLESKLEALEKKRNKP